MDNPPTTSNDPPAGTPRPEDLTSGDLVKQILKLPAGSRVSQVKASVTGATFHGRVANLQGARVLESPVIYAGKPQSLTTESATATNRAFILDFGRSISVMGVKLTVPGTITFVLPWLGADFSQTPAYKATPPAKPAATDDVALSGLEASKLLIQVNGAKFDKLSLPRDLVITTGTFPANVRASLNERLPFWSHPGSLDKTVALTGMVADLNALRSAASEDPVAVVLTLTSDAPAVLEVDFDAAGGVQVDRVADARWGGQASVDVPLAALARQRVTVPFPTESPKTWKLHRLIVEARGVFGPWRAYPAQATAAAGTLGLRIDASFSVARRLRVADDAQLHGIALLLRSPVAPAELHVAVAADAEGAPGTGEPVAAAALALAPVEGAQPVAWYEVLFASPVDLSKASGAWLVVQAKTGAAEWVAAAEQATSGGRTLGAAQGGRWNRYPAPAPGAEAVAQARILRRPFANENAPLLELAWGDGAGDRVSFDPGRDVITVELARAPSAPLEASATDHTIELTATAGASGTLTLERVTTLYREAAP